MEEAASGRKGCAGGDDDVEVRQGMSMREIRATMEEEEADDAEEVGRSTFGMLSDCDRIDVGPEHRGCGGRGSGAFDDAEGSEGEGC